MNRNETFNLLPGGATPATVSMVLLLFSTLVGSSAMANDCGPGDCDAKRRAFIDGALSVGHGIHSS